MRPKFSLQQVTVYRAGSSTNSSTTSLCKLIGDTIASNSEETVSCQLQVPADATPTLYNCELISVDYYLKVRERDTVVVVSAQLPCLTTFLILTNAPRCIWTSVLPSTQKWSFRWSSFHRSFKGPRIQAGPPGARVTATSLPLPSPLYLTLHKWVRGLMDTKHQGFTHSWTSAAVAVNSLIPIVFHRQLSHRLHFWIRPPPLHQGFSRERSLRPIRPFSLILTRVSHQGQVMG